MSRRTLGVLGALALLLVSSLVGAAAVGTVAAQEATVTPDGDGNLANETLVVDNDTQSLYVEATNITNDTANVTVYGVDADGNETQEATATLNTSTSSTDLYEFTSVNATAYEEYRVTVAGDGAESLEIGTVERIAGGGGGFIGGGGGIGLGALAVVGVAAFLLMRD